MRFAQRVIEKDVRRLRRRSGMDERALEQYLDQLVTGLENQLYNAPLDMVIDRRIYDKHPFLRDSQLTWLAAEHESYLKPLTDPTLREMTPAKIYQANLAMNAAGALLLDELSGRATDFAAQYRSSGVLATGQKLYGLWQKTMQDFSPSDEYDLVDSFARELKLEDWYAWKDDGEGSAPPPRAEADTISTPTPLGDTSQHGLLAEPAAQMAATMYMLSALRRFAKMSRDEVYQIAGEIALLGQSGIDYSSSDQKFTLRFLPGEQFSGIQLLSMMFVGFKQIDPELDTGIPLDNAYRQALQLYESGM